MERRPMPDPIGQEVLVMIAALSLMAMLLEREQEFGAFIVDAYMNERERKMA